jgi:hypothetical protein
LPGDVIHLQHTISRWTGSRWAIFLIHSSWCFMALSMMITIFSSASERDNLLWTTLYQNSQSWSIFSRVVTEDNTLTIFPGFYIVIYPRPTECEYLLPSCVPLLVARRKQVHPFFESPVRCMFVWTTLVRKSNALYVSFWFVCASLAVVVMRGTRKHRLFWFMLSCYV